MTRVLGVDVGSTTIKASLLEPDGRTPTMTHSRPFPAATHGLPVGRFEIDVPTVTGIVRTVIEEALGEARDVRHVLMCGQMGGLVLVDGQGHSRSPYYSWRDQRVLEGHPRESGSFYEAYCRRLTEADRVAIGGELRPGSTSTLLFWLAETGHQPSSDLRPVTLVDAILADLCRTAPATDPTQALGLLDVARGEWSSAVFRAAGQTRLRHSRLTSVRDQIGTCRIGGRELVCHPAVGDQQAALLGVDVKPGELSINCSTGSQVSEVVDRWTPGNYQTRPYFDGQFLNTVTHLPAGRSLNVLVDLLTELARAEGVPLKHAWSTIASEASKARCDGLEADLAFFSGPLGEAGALRGITTENLTVGRLFRAAFENMADNYKACADRLNAFGNWTQVVLSGGLTHKLPVLRELIASRFVAPLRESREVEETLAGLQKLAVGVLSEAGG